MVAHFETPETIRLVEELSDLTGEHPAAIVETALREQLRRVRVVQARMAREPELQALVDRLAARFTEPYKSLDHGEWLYGEDGLPR